MSETANLDVSQGGSGAPGNAAPAGNGTEGNQGARNPAGDGNRGITPAAWTAQLSKEFKDNPDALKAIGNFKTVSELAEAFLKQSAGKSGGTPGQDGGGTAGDDALEKALEEAAKAAGQSAPPKQEPAAWLDAKAVKETVAKLVEEFGTAAPDYYRKALAKNGLGAVLGKHGLKSHPDLGRALVLLGREMSEDCTPGGGSSGSGGSGGAVTIAEGARLY